MDTYAHMPICPYAPTCTCMLPSFYTLLPKLHGPLPLPHSINPSSHFSMTHYLSPPEYTRASPVMPNILRDEDETSEIEGGWLRLNTLGHYMVVDGSLLLLVPRKNHPEPGRCRCCVWGVSVLLSAKVC